MPEIPNLTDPRYLDEVGWFLYYEKYNCESFGGSYEGERRFHSKMFLDEVLGFCKKSQEWITDKTVVTIGCGCTGDLVTWPAAVKIAIDPMLYAYQHLGMLLDDNPGTSRTVYLPLGAEEISLIDESADLVICRNALDHMHHPERALQEIARILRHNGRFFLDVDFGGKPTPDEPTIFSLDSLSAMLETDFEVFSRIDNNKPNSKHRESSSRILMLKKGRERPSLVNKEAILQAYIDEHGLEQ